MALSSAIRADPDRAQPGPATGVSSIFDIEQATRFCIEVAKLYSAGRCPFYASEEWANLQTRYGSLERLQTMGYAP